MEEMVASSEMRRRLGKMLQSVVTQGDCFVVARYGRPVAALVPMELYRKLQQPGEPAEKTTR